MIINRKFILWVLMFCGAMQHSAKASPEEANRLLNCMGLRLAMLENRCRCD
jgi:hypothetical protein